MTDLIPITKEDEALLDRAIKHKSVDNLMIGLQKSANKAGDERVPMEISTFVGDDNFPDSEVIVITMGEDAHAYAGPKGEIALILGFLKQQAALSCDCPNCRPQVAANDTVH